MAEVYRCKWLGCLSPKEAIRSSPLLLNAHLRDVHIFPSAGETRCNWLSCTYQVPPSLSDATPQRIASALALHARIHVPSASATEIRLPLPVKATQAKETIRYTLLNAPTNDAAKTNAVGRGFMACLVFRNVARAIRQGISPSYRHPGDIPDEEEDEVDGEYSAGAGGGGGGGGELFAAVSSSKGGANQTVEEREEEEGREAAARDEADHSRQLAINAVPALLSLETEVVRFAVECRAFAQPLGEVLEVVAFLRKREAVVAVDRMQD